MSINNNIAHNNDAGEALAASNSDNTIVIAPHGTSFAEAMKSLWRYRELAGFLIWRDFKVRYRQSILGAAWAIIRPVMSMIVFSIIFGRWVGLDTGEVPYPVFVYAGLLPWSLFNGAVSQGAMSLLNNSHLFTKVYFPRALLPVSTIGVVLVDFLLAALVYVAILAYYQFVPPITVLWLPLLVMLTLVLSLGISLLLSGLAVMYRDLRAVIPFVMQTWMYLSPVIYPVTIIPEKFRAFGRLNPLVGIINAFRASLTGSAMNMTDLTAAIIISALMLIIGSCVFASTEKKLADIA